MQNKPNLRNDKMNINSDMTSIYEILYRSPGPKTNPIQSQFNPIQTQFKANKAKNKANSNPNKPNFKRQISVFSFLCSLVLRPSAVIHRSFSDEAQIIEFLPNFGHFVLSTSLDNERKKQEIHIDNHRHKNSQGTLKIAILADKKIPPRGVEPLSPG